ncbi:hypothetical protein JW921_04695 [Candidatus Fermentibacterales bacterium]|nr:hypothetical protein [Candidatus Fermentibacterales bacterium]
MRPVLIAALSCLGLLSLPGCGRRSQDVDGAGLLEGGTDLVLFARASQHYFRGSLSRAEDDFNRVIYSFEDSRLADDARLAVRRIEQDRLELTSTDTVSANGDASWPVIALVGQPGVSATMERLRLAFVSRGISAEVIEDQGAPDMTVVLYPTALESRAGELADTLESWLTRPADVPVQRSGTIHETIVPGHSGLLVVVGRDANVRQTAPGMELVHEADTTGLEWMIP